MSETLSVLIADDERPARAKLRQFVTADTSVTRVYEAGDGERALHIIRESAPDVIFLDIQMPGATGIEVAEHIATDAGHVVVFVTAFDEFAVKAFDLHAADYLLKPFDQERFTRAWDKVKRTIAADNQEQRFTQLKELLSTLGHAEQPAYVKRLMLPDGDKTLMIDVGDVTRLEAEGNYVTVFARRRRFRTRGTISDYEKQLDPREFARVNRSTIINVSCIEELQSAGHGDRDIVMKDGCVVRLSRRFKGRLDPAADARSRPKG